MPQMSLLLTNDDGVHAPGLAAMAEALSGRHPFITVAPAEEQSGMSHALTMNRPLRIGSHGEARWSVDGTPVDCVYVAIHKLCSALPTVVVSGINKGANLGDDVFYSGTVGAAREAALNGIAALAVSLDLTENPGEAHFETAGSIAADVVDRMLRTPLPAGCFLNLNVPNRPLSAVHGLVVCPLGQRHYEPLVEEHVDPRGKPYFWIGGEPVGEKMAVGSDGNWVGRGYATLTPLGLDNTSQVHLDDTNQWVPAAFRSST
jgi:5'-nucleotidase